jgi:outer membrane protein
MRRAIVAMALAGAMVAAHARAQPQGKTYTLEQCVAIAVQHNPDAKASDAEVDAANAGRAGVRGEFGPKLRAEGNVQQWNSPFDLPFGPQVFRVRDAFTWSGSVSVIQPVTSLWAIYDQYKVQSLGVDVATIQRDAAKRDIAFRTAEAYLRVLETDRLTEVAAASVTQLEAQLKQAQSLLANGVIAKNDELRAELALASARQRLIQTRGNVLLARGQLATLMGMPTDASIVAAPVASGDAAPPLDEATLGSAEAHAASQRLELRAVDRKIEQSEARVAFAKKKLLPQVNVVGNYTHTEGSEFAQKDAAFIGVFGTWDIWDWGTRSNGVAEADARRSQEQLARKKLEDHVKLEARQAFVQATTAKEALVVARAALTQAEENYRIVTKRFEQNASTSFDVVDAESLLTQARAQVETALYGYLVARLALQRAIGASAPRAR